MSFDTNKMAIKLLRCRRNLEMNLKEVSELSGIPESRLCIIENGHTEPYGDEILILADIYQEDFKYFISNEKLSASEKVEELYRINGQEFTKEDKRAIQTFISLCSNEQFVWDSLQIINHPFKLPRINQDFINKEDGAFVAQHLRRHLGYKELQSYQNLYYEFRKLGIHIFRKKLQNSGLSGIFIRHPEAGLCILINCDDNIYRQNFTLAHEVGHALMDGADFNVSLNQKDNKTAYRESRANAFASNFLIPPDIIKKIPKTALTSDFIRKQADKFRVNVPAFLIALNNAGVINEVKLNEFKSLSIKVPKAEQRDYEFEHLTERLIDSYNFAMERGLSPSYIRICHRAYSENLISSERLAEMLLTDIHDLPFLLDLFKLKIES
jgi:Zn-dependent peptidase ImmA (M78 family)